MLPLLFPATLVCGSRRVPTGPRRGMAPVPTVPSPGQCLAPALTEPRARAPWAELTALAYPSEDFAAEYGVASKAVGRSPWYLLSPTAFGGSEFASENGQTAPQTVGHRTPPVPQPCSGSGANASFWKGHFSPAPGTLQIKSINPGWEHRGHSVQ